MSSGWTGRWIIGVLLLAAIPCARAMAQGTAATTAKPAGTRSPADSRLSDAGHALQAGDLDRAFQLGTAYLKAHPASAAANVLLARIAMAKSDPDAAYTHLRAALAASPADVDTLYYLGMLSGQLSEREFQQLARIAPDSAQLHQLAAESLVAEEKRADAEVEYQAALKADPNLYEALLGLAKLERIRLACEEAAVLYQKAEAIRPSFDGAYGLGVCQSYLQDDEAAAKSFDRALAIDSKAAVAWVGLGTSLTKLGRAAEAIPKLQRAVALEPGMTEAYYALGMAYRATGDQARAAEAFQRAQQRGPTSGSASPAVPPKAPQ